MQIEFQKLADAYQELPTWAGRLVVGLDDSQLQWKPGPKKWSIAEILIHTAKSVEMYLPQLEEAVEESRVHGGLHSKKSKVNKWINAWILKIESSRIPLIAPRRLHPAPEDSMKEALDRFVRDHSKVLECIQAIGSVKDAGNMRIRVPVLPICSMSIAQCFLVLLMHTRRHLKQIEGIKRLEDFPE